jgi:formate dehydrogenase subunit beta
VGDIGGIFMGYYILENQEELKKVFKNLMKKNIVDGILVQTQGEHGIFNSLITDPNQISKTVPLAPLFSTNTATFLQNNGKRKIAVVVKPCEARAIIELKKLNQLDLENIIVICGDCFGTIDPKDGTLTEPADVVQKKESIRKACTVCEHFTPPEVDIGVLSIGTGGCVLVTEKEELVEGLDLKSGDAPGKRDEEVKKIMNERTANKTKMVEDAKKQLSSTDSLVETFKYCIRCDNCRDVCPICYCKECYYESPLGDLKTDEMLYQAAVKGLLRIPPDILFYHLTRNIHVASSCVECGACEEACPRDIPLLSIWKAISGDVQSLFEYVSGMSPDDELPLVKFKEIELEEV